MPQKSDQFTLENVLERFTIAPVAPLTEKQLQAVITGVEIHDVLCEMPATPNTLLIAPQAQVLDAPQLQALIAQAKAKTYCAIAVKVGDETLPTLSTISEKAQIPVLRVANNLSWSLFEAQLFQLLGEQRGGEALQIEHSTEPLAALTNELANHFGGSVTVEDLGRRIVAYSTLPGQVTDEIRTNGILFRTVPDTELNDEQYRAVLQAEGPVFFEQTADELPRTAVAIRVGSMPLGTIWAIDVRHEKRDTTHTLQKLREAQELAAAQLLEVLHYRDASNQPRENRFRALLEGAKLHDREVAELSYGESRPAALIALDPGPTESPNLLAQLRQTVHRQLAVRFPDTVATVHGAHVWVLLPTNNTFNLEQALITLLDVCDRIFNLKMRASMPGITCRVEEIVELRHQAEQLLTVDQNRPANPPRRLLTNEKLKPLIFLDAISKLLTNNKILINTKVKELCAAEPEIAGTLLRWCSTRGNVAQTAKQLAIHENTVRARLNKVVKSYAIAIDDPDEFFTVWLQLRAAEIAGEI